MSRRKCDGCGETRDGEMAAGARDDVDDGAVCGGATWVSKLGAVRMALGAVLSTTRPGPPCARDCSYRVSI